MRPQSQARLPWDTTEDGALKQPGPAITDEVSGNGGNGLKTEIEIIPQETAPAAKGIAGNEQDEPEDQGFDLTYRLGVPLDQDVIQDVIQDQPN